MKKEIFLGEHFMKRSHDDYWYSGKVYLYNNRFLIYWDHYPNYMYYDMDEIQFRDAETIKKLKKEILIKEIIE